jgi:hypothetical protein
LKHPELVVTDDPYPYKLMMMMMKMVMKMMMMIVDAHALSSAPHPPSAPASL